VNCALSIKKSPPSINDSRVSTGENTSSTIVTAPVRMLTEEVVARWQCERRSHWSLRSAIHLPKTNWIEKLRQRPYFAIQQALN
jgi:hypothetical protein